VLGKTTILAIVLAIAALAGLNWMASGWVEAEVASRCVQEAVRPIGESPACTIAARELVSAPKEQVYRWFVLDNFFIVLYVATFVLIALASARAIFGARLRSALRMLVVSIAVGVAFAAGGADAMENMRAIEVLRGRVGDARVSIETAREIAAAMELKWMLIAMALAISAVLALGALASRLFSSRKPLTQQQ
jgi:hypothetical protein